MNKKELTEAITSQILSNKAQSEKMKNGKKKKLQHHELMMLRFSSFQGYGNEKENE